MAANMSIAYEVRLNILEALLKKNCVCPNFRQIKRCTGYHLATIKSSIEFMQKEGLLTGFGPKVDLRHFGYNLEVIEMVQADFSKRALAEKLGKANMDDPHVYRASSLIGPGNRNLVVRQIYKDVESYHKRTQEKYFGAIPEIYEFIRNRQAYYEVEPHYKSTSRTEALIKLIRMEKGLD